MFGLNYVARNFRAMNMKIKSKTFHVRSGKMTNLKEWPTKVKPFFESKKQY